MHPIFPPAQLGDTADYAVEARIKMDSLSNSGDGVFGFGFGFGGYQVTGFSRPKYDMSSIGD